MRNITHDHLSHITRLKVHPDWNDETKRIYSEIITKYPHGIFATGIESSDPWVNEDRRDELTEGDNFRYRYAKRLRRIRDLGIQWIRFGDGYSKVHIGPGKFNFELTDKVLQKCHELEINVIADLMHFGLPEWQHQNNPHQPFFLNPHFPHYFAEYAEVFAKRYPSIHCYNLINEPYVSARFSDMLGIWNEAHADDLSFTKAIVHTAEAMVLAKERIEKVWRDENRSASLYFFQNESFEKAYGTGASLKKANEFNQVKKFIALDLFLGHKDKNVKNFLLEHNISDEKYEWFMNHGNKNNVVLGIDYYPTCIQTITDSEILYGHDIRTFHLIEVIKEYYQRYKLPLFHMEINAINKTAKQICQKTFNALNLLRVQGYPIIPGMTWYGDDNFCGWDSFLHCTHINHVGLYNKNIRMPIANFFSKLAKSSY
ncbi:MAG TPA: family 1 glycosylhydrolase [Candidatus Nitrosocosmicus sp.]|nr:family 1 glycosylhydrolase [Candidatus Nitrosocosmicus sp.]